jgi:dTDP-4-amino-4,6-dideoxygalactose transaminase
VTERLTRRSLILPLFHGLSEGDQERVVTALDRGIRAGG